VHLAVAAERPAGSYERRRVVEQAALSLAESRDGGEAVLTALLFQERDEAALLPRFREGHRLLRALEIVSCAAELRQDHQVCSCTPPQQLADPGDVRLDVS